MLINGEQAITGYTHHHSGTQRRVFYLRPATVLSPLSHQQDVSIMSHKLVWIACFMFVSSPAFAATQCGPFYLKPDKSGWFSVNGERAKTQKVTFAKEKGDYDNATVKLLVKNSKAPGMVDMELTNREGKGLLRAEIVRTSQSQIRIRGAYDCEPAK